MPGEEACKTVSFAAAGARVHATEVAEHAHASVIEFGESGQEAVTLTLHQSVGILPDAHHQGFRGEYVLGVRLYDLYNGVFIVQARMFEFASDEEIDGGAVGR